MPASAFQLASDTVWLPSMSNAASMLPAPQPFVAATAITLVPSTSSGLISATLNVRQPLAMCSDDTSVPLT